MTLDAVAGRETSYYPHGRARQRPTTLLPEPYERPNQVLDDWQSSAAELDRIWSTLDDTQWSTEVVEPAENPDLGTVTLGRLALARLTEVDVHATDLGIGAPDWSSTLVEVGLPTRLVLAVDSANESSGVRPIDPRLLAAARDRWTTMAGDG